MADTIMGQLEAGNIDLNNRPRVRNPDGSISTVRSLGVNFDGREVLIPTVVGDRVVSDDEAIAEYKRTGKHLGVFDTPEHATAYADSLHNQQAEQIKEAPNKGLVDSVYMPNAQAVGEGSQQEALRTRSTYGETAKAGYDNWAHTAIMDKVNMPSFLPETGFDQVGRLNRIPFPLSEDEEKFLQSSSNAEFDYKLDKLTAYRKNAQALGDNPITGFAVMALDPTYLALDIATAGAAKAIRAGALARRLTAATVGAGGAYGLGLVEQETKPISDKEIAFNALLNGAVSTLFMGHVKDRGRVLVTDPDFPQRALTDLVQDLKPKVDVTMTDWKVQRDIDGNIVKHDNGTPVLVRTDVKRIVDTDRAATILPKIDVETVDVAIGKTGKVDVAVPPKVQGKSARSELERVIANPGDDATIGAFAQRFLDRMGPMADRIRVRRDAKVTRSYYDPNDHSIHLRENAEPRIVVHEMAHALTVAKMRHGLHNPTSAHGKLASEIESIRKNARKSVTELTDKETRYYLNDPLEFLAGLYSGHKPFIDLLRSIPDPAAGQRRSLLQSFVDSVRLMLGFGPNETNAFIRSLDLTEALQDIPHTYKILGRPLKGPGSRSPAKPMTLHYGPNGGAVPASVPTQTIAAQLDDLAKRTGRGGEWSLSKSLRKYSDKVSKLLVDDPLDKSGNSATSYSRSIRAELSALQYKFEDQLTAAMKAEGIGTFQRVFNPRKAMAVQRNIEKEVALEMLERNQRVTNGLPAKLVGAAETRATRMADALDEIATASAKEMQASGVLGSEGLELTSGYFSRRWSSRSLTEIEERIANTMNLPVSGGRSSARTVVRELMANAIRKANPGMDAELASDISGAILDRTRRRGDFSDAEFKGHIGSENLVAMRDELTRAGLTPQRIQRVMDTLSGVVEDANTASYLKSRVKMDVFETMRLPDGTSISVHDLMNSDIANITERYLDDVAGRSGLARVGLGTEESIQNLRTDMVQGLKSADEKRDAAELFNNTIDAIRGRPVGAEMEKMLRYASGATQMVGLSGSGMWQVTEYAKIMMHYGLFKTLKYALKEFPGFRGLMGSTTDEAGSLANVLARNSSQDIRMRPFLHKLEDNYEIPMSSVGEQVMQQAKQWVPYLNGMKYVHHHQARVAANLITDTLLQGARGNRKALAALESYGLGSSLMDTIKADIRRFGADTTKWSDETWDAVRNPLNRMIDDDVLRSRLGELPAFAQFSQVGKFIFTFRSFVLSAHNKILAGTLHQQGFAGLTLMLAYQFPLTLAMVQANEAVAGRKSLEDDEWVSAAIAQMGGLGLLSEIYGAFTGDKKQFGSPGMIAVDRLYRFTGEVGSGDWSGAASAGVNMVPIISLIPGLKALGQALKE